MRGTRALLLAALLAGTVLVSGSLGEIATRTCAARVWCGHLWLPAPVSITVPAARTWTTFRIGRDGRIRRSTARNPLLPDAAYVGHGVWFRIAHAHLVIGRHARVMWRSRGEIASRWQLGVVLVGRQLLAFQHDHHLYLAPWRGAERPVARRELPLGWTAGGLYTYGYQRRELLLRSDTGRLRRVIARGPLGSDYQVANGSLYFIRRGVLMRAHAARVSRLASLASLGLSARPWLQSLGRLVELLDNHRLVVLRSDGSVFAATPLPLGPTRSDSVTSSLAVGPMASGVAFTTGAPGQPAQEVTVYVLPRGGRAAIPLHRERLALPPCAGGATVAWRGRWLLYSAGQGYAAVIDSTGRHRAIELGPLVSGLPGTRNGFFAHWSGQPTLG